MRVGTARRTGSLRGSAVGGGRRLGVSRAHVALPLCGFLSGCVGLLFIPGSLHSRLPAAAASCWEPRRFLVRGQCQDPCHLPGAGVCCVLTLVFVSAAAPRFGAQAGLNLERRALDVCQSRASVTPNLVRFLIREMFFHTKNTGNGHLPHLAPGPGAGKTASGGEESSEAPAPRATLHRCSARSVSLGRCGCSSRSRGGEQGVCWRHWQCDPELTWGQGLPVTPACSARRQQRTGPRGRAWRGSSCPKRLTRGLAPPAVYMPAAETEATCLGCVLRGCEHLTWKRDAVVPGVYNLIL